MREVVIDANIVLRACLKGEPHRRTARRLLRYFIQNHTLLAPPLFEAEVDSAIVRSMITKGFTTQQANSARRIALAIPVRIATHSQLRQRAWEIAVRSSQERVYDATYAALAELRNCDLWTADRKFHAAVSQDLPFVKYLLDFSPGP